MGLGRGIVRGVKTPHWSLGNKLDLLALSSTRLQVLDKYLLILTSAYAIDIIDIPKAYLW